MMLRQPPWGWKVPIPAGVFPADEREMEGILRVICS